MSRACWILILSLLILKTTSLQAESRTLLREIGNNKSCGSDPKVYGVELSATDFDGVLNETPAAYAIVEFYAHCPIFKKLPGFSMDLMPCIPINRDLCNKFCVSHYPMLFWGPATKFTSAWKPMKQKVKYISYGLDDEKEQISCDISDPEQAITETAAKVEIMTRRMEELGITVEEDSSQTITTFEDAAYLIQKLCREKSAWKNIHYDLSWTVHMMMFDISLPSLQSLRLSCRILFMFNNLEIPC
ncbi:hypothetical protein V6N13_142734 [Hibiscus sabdariffa]|uniref:Uncharacterized protein n=1 Tax=Hibiscus sabdariffa TaxID=183260 RepID=A0ABR2FF30_9ROSI